MAQGRLETGVPGNTRVIQTSTAQERREIPQNSFLGFIDEQQALFTGFSSSVRRLREEEQAWRNSPRLAALLDEVVGIIRDGSPTTVDPKREQEFRRRYTEALLRDTESPLSGDETIQFRGQLLLPFRIEWDRWGERVEQFAEDYKAVRKPIRDAVLETRKALFAQFEEYLKAELKHLFDFRDFLTDRKLASAREGIKPFLTSLAEHVFRTREKDGNMLAQVRREWVERERDNIRDDILRPFLLSQNKGLGPNLYELLKFAFELYHPGKEVSDEEILYVLRQVGLSKWPEDFRSGYQKFAAATVASVVAEIQKGLEPYRKFS